MCTLLRKGKFACAFRLHVSLNSGPHYINCATLRKKKKTAQHRQRRLIAFRLCLCCTVYFLKYYVTSGPATSSVEQHHVINAGCTDTQMEWHSDTQNTMHTLTSPLNTERAHCITVLLTIISLEGITFQLSQIYVKYWQRSCFLFVIS